MTNPTDQEILGAMEAGLTVCVIKRSQDKQLLKNRMPGNVCFKQDKWARYRSPKFGEPLQVSRYACEWSGRTVKFKIRDDSDPAPVWHTA